MAEGKRTTLESSQTGQRTITALDCRLAEWLDVEDNFLRTLEISAEEEAGEQQQENEQRRECDVHGAVRRGVSLASTPCELRARGCHGRKGEASLPSLDRDVDRIGRACAVARREEATDLLRIRCVLQGLQELGTQDRFHACRNFALDTGRPYWSRTSDQRIKSPLLYHLS